MKNFYLLIVFLTMRSISAQLNHIEISDQFEVKNYSREDILKINSKLNNFVFNKRLNSRSVIKARLDSTNFEFFSEVDNKYVPSSSRKYFYDANQNSRSYNRYSYNNTLGVLWMSGRGEFSYDKNDKLVGLKTFVINRTSGIESPSSKFEYGYNNLGQCESEILHSFSRVDSVFYISYKTEFFYNSMGAIDYYINYDYNKDSAKFQLSSKFTNEYDNLNNNTIILRENWDELTKSYIPAWKSERRYNNKNKLILDQDSIWKDNSWYPYEEYYYKYNSSNKLITLSYSSYDSASGIFIDTTRDELTLDLAFQLNDIIIPDAFNIPIANSIWDVKLESYESFVHDGVDWRESSKTRYFYEFVNISSSNKTESTNNIVYPNPSTGFVFVNSEITKNISNVIITDVNGKQMKPFLIDFNNSINFSSLENGIYYLQFQLKDGSIVRNKVIKI